MIAHPRRIPVEGPSLRDPRLHLAAVLIGVQILGQTSLGFELSIAQILVSIATCAAIEVAITFRRRRVIAWPASAMLTGNGVALILRVAGTRHGDWFSLHGAWIFAGVAAASIASKYAIRAGGRHLFNPSNIGLVAAFLVIGSSRVSPQDLWWGPMSAGLAGTYVLVVAGGLAITQRLRLLGAAAGFWIAFAGSVAVVSSAGHCISARWHIGPLCGASFWWTLVSSPEVLVFLFFMITDPKTAPATPRARAVFGAAVGILAALLAAPLSSEQSTKIAILGALALLTPASALLDRMPSRPARRPSLNRVATAVGAFGLIVAALTAAGIPARPAAATVAPIAPSAIPPAPPVPPVTVSAEARRLDRSLTPAAANAIARDFAQDLAVLADAVRLRDAARARGVATGPVLAHALNLIGSAAPADVATYRFEALQLVVVRDPARPQGTPLLGFRAKGFAVVQRHDAEHRTVGPALRRPVDQVFVVVKRGSRFVLG